MQTKLLINGKLIAGEGRVDLEILDELAAEIGTVEL